MVLTEITLTMEVVIHKTESMAVIQFSALANVLGIETAIVHAKSVKVLVQSTTSETTITSQQETSVETKAQTEAANNNTDTTKQQKQWETPNTYWMASA